MASDKQTVNKKNIENFCYWELTKVFNIIMYSLKSQKNTGI